MEKKRPQSTETELHLHGHWEDAFRSRRFRLFRSWLHYEYGSVDSENRTMLVLDGEKLKWSDVAYTPAALGIVEEFVLRAVRTDGVDALRIEVSSDHYLTVGHNGSCMDFEKPQMVFGGSSGNMNIADWEKQFQAFSPDPVGPTLEEIIYVLSDELEVEISDATKGKTYKQVLRSKTHPDMEPKIISYNGTRNWSRVRLKFFNLPDFEKLIKTRLVEINATISNTVSIEFNHNTLPVKKFQQLVDIYPKMILEGRPDANKRFCIKLGEYIELCITRSNGTFTQYCFINGRHVINQEAHINLVVERFLEHARKMDGLNFNEEEFKSNMALLMSCSDDPSCSELKDRLSGLSDDFVDKCVEYITNITRKECIRMKVLKDATEAGGENSSQCTLILTEGESAKSFVMSGMGILGRERYGVLALKGKVENARASDVQESANRTVQNIMNALGLDSGACYKTAYKLRYGRVILMMDQDTDGTHIKGLLLNLFDKYWPSLLKIDKFLSDFAVPLIKAKAIDGSDTKLFYSMEKFKESDVKKDISSWDITYVKGLGSLTRDDAKKYFANMDEHRRYFEWSSEMDSRALIVCFHKEKLNDRKSWLMKTMYTQKLQIENEMVAVDPTNKFIEYHKFVDKELSLYSIDDMLRSTASMMDGLKTTQRKVLFTALEDLNTKKRVDQFAGTVLSKTVYRHGSDSIEGTIIAMAQTFVGSNNINLLEPIGQFGSRYEGGKDKAEPHYLHVQLSDITKLIFRDEDKDLLEYLEEEGLSVQPKWYLPVVPMSLVNGTTGIGSGWGSNVPNYSPNDVINALLKLLENPTIAKDVKSISLTPGYRGFKGRIEKYTGKEYGVNCTIYGCAKEISDTVIEINEIPLSKTIDSYYNFLVSLMPDSSRSASSKKKYPTIECFQELHEDDNNLRFKVVLDKTNMESAKKGLLSAFNLVSQMSVESLNLIDELQELRTFDTAEEMLITFFEMRLPYYEARKAKLLEKMSNNMTRVDNTIMYIKAMDKGEIKLMNRKKLIAKFTEKGYKSIPNDGDSGFDHLINLSCDEHDIECVPNLMAEKETLHRQMEEMKKLSKFDLWKKDLEELQQKLAEKGMAPQKRKEAVELLSASSPTDKKAKRGP